MPTTAKAHARGSDTVTQGIRVRVTPRYLPAESDPDARRWVFAYHVVISNQSDRRAKLQARHWVIVDADGRAREVRGEGVVGECPDLAPGQSHEYASYCPLPTAWGTMEGSYQMEGEDGREFAARVARFYLVAPTHEA